MRCRSGEAGGAEARFKRYLQLHTTLTQSTDGKEQRQPTGRHTNRHGLGLSRPV